LFSSFSYWIVEFISYNLPKKVGERKALLQSLDCVTGGADCKCAFLCMAKLYLSFLKGIGFYFSVRCRFFIAGSNFLVASVNFLTAGRRYLIAFDNFLK